jgi:hypothetical protein
MENGECEGKSRKGERGNRFESAVICVDPRLRRLRRKGAAHASGTLALQSAAHRHVFCGALAMCSSYGPFAAKRRGSCKRDAREM